MKTLKECIQAALGAAVPANTTGMGNPSMDSGDIPVAISGKPRKLKLLKRKKKNRQKHS